METITEKFESIEEKITTMGVIHPAIIHKNDIKKAICFFNDKDFPTVKINADAAGSKAKVIYDLAYKSGYLTLHQNYSWRGGVVNQAIGKVKLIFNDMQIIVYGFDMFAKYNIDDLVFMDATVQMPVIGKEKMIFEGDNDDIEKLITKSDAPMVHPTFQEQDTLKYKLS